MTPQLQRFVFDTLSEWGAARAELAPNVYRIQLPEGAGGQAAWYLARPTGELLLTFDLQRWEEGARLECLTPVSPLVRRLQMYAEAKGVYAIATLRPASTDGNKKYNAFLLCRFSDRCSSFRVVEERRWLAANLTTGAAVKVAGDPLDADGVVEGEPIEALRIPPKVAPEAALRKLVGLWEQQVSQRAKTFVNESESAYMAEAEEAMRVLDGDELDERMEMLGQRYAPVVESHLEAAILLWR